MGGEPLCPSPKCGGSGSSPGCITASLFTWKFDDNTYPVPNAVSRALEPTVGTGAEPLTCPGVPGRFSWWLTRVNFL